MEIEQNIFVFLHSFLKKKKIPVPSTDILFWFSKQIFISFLEVFFTKGKNEPQSLKHNPKANISCLVYFTAFLLFML
jgi:hypothetical protein